MPREQQSKHKLTPILHVLFNTVSFAHRLLNEAQLEILAFQRALKECVLSVDDAYGKSFEEFYVGFEGR